MANELPAINWYEKLADWGWSAFGSLCVMVIGWVLWINRQFNAMRSDHDAYKLHVSENYVKKSDLSVMKADIAADFNEVKEGLNQITDLLMKQKIGTTARRR
ncbi:hypothetical protein ABIB06_006537 [Bradyrhizobium sp. LB8.2]|uniref:hypothetical protein n=1 Tax=unclassified Bradyrhizobium TaxID=2631580 RepID=UPI0033965D21